MCGGVMSLWGGGVGGEVYQFKRGGGGG